MFTQLTGTDILHVPYKGSAPAVTDLLGGQVNMMFDNIPSSLPHIKSGKLHAIATTGAKRDPALPDLPTVAEAGVPGYESGVWFGLMVPAATPKDVIGKLNAAAVQATKSPEFQKRMHDLGYNIIPGTPGLFNLHPPLAAAFWISGYCVFATAKAPISASTLVYGSEDGASSIRNSLKKSADR